MNLNRWEVHGLIFITGASILAIELIASRFMTPMFGSSLYIWGAILSVTLVCLSVGYSWGGRMADRLDEPYRRLIQLVLFSALWVGLIPVINYPVAVLSLNAGSFFGPIIVMTLLFAFPITLLATATPMAFGTLNHETGGTHPAQSIGDLFAISTVGSVVGALTTAYLLIPNFGLRWSFATVAVLLIAGCLPAIWRNTGLRLGIIVVAVLSLTEFMPEDRLGKPSFNYGIKELERISSRYSDIAILELEDKSRILLTDGISQNWVSGRHLDFSNFDYITVAVRHLKRYPNHPKRALVLGLGAGTAVKQLAALGYNVDAVEIDPTMIYIAEKYFNFNSDDHDIFVDDARNFLRQAVDAKDKYGLVFHDTTGFGNQPAHLYTQEAFSLIKEVLSPGGLVVTNQVLFVNSGENQIANASAATLASVYPYVEAYDVYAHQEGPGVTNLLMFASMTAPASTPTGSNEKLFLFDKNSPIITDNWNPGDVWSVNVADDWHRTIRSWLGNAALIPI